MKKKMLQALVLQSIGPFLLFGLSIGIGRSFGAEMQGRYASSKALLDLLVAFGSFGFPQSVVLSINRDSVSRSHLYRDAVQYSIVVAVLFVPFLLVLNLYRDAEQQISLLFAISGACLVLNNIWRGILLTIHDGVPFHLITIIPAVCVTLSVSFALVVLPEFNPNAIASAFAVAGLGTLIMSYALFPLRKVKTHGGIRPNYLKIANNGSDVFAQAMAFSVQTYFFLSFLVEFHGNTEAGYFSMALIAFQVLLLPLQMVSPMVLNKWSKRLGEDALVAGRLSERLILGGAVGLVVLGVPLVPWAFRLILGDSFLPAIPATQICILAVLPALMVRVINLRMAAVGEFRANTVVAITRLGGGLLALLSAASWGMPSWWSASTTAAAAWLVSEVVSAILAKQLIKRRIRSTALMSRA